MKRDRGQRALRELRKRFAEKGFFILSLKKRYRKDEYEFLAAKFLGENRDSAIIRLFRGGVRVRFLEGDSSLLHDLKRHLLLGIEADISFVRKAWNPTPKGNALMWHDFVYRRELEEVDPEGVALRNDPMRIPV